PQIGLNVYKSVSANGKTFSGSGFNDPFRGIGEDFFKTIDIAVALGLQYTFLKHLTIGARYNLGLTNAFNVSTPIDDEGVNADFSGWKNSTIQASVGWAF
ncbi:MAG: PorT family protein, partial [Prevotellaceae bacterium]|nr:PorT family protein [Prevotellaceae bacterium]